MARTKTRKPMAVAADGSALEGREQALGLRIATNAAELEQTRAEVERLQGEQDAALRDGIGGRERAKALVADILAAERTVELLKRERELLAEEQLDLRATEAAEVLRAEDEKTGELIRTLAAAASAVDKRLRGVGEALGNFAALLAEFFDVTAMAPPPAAATILSRWRWGEEPAEVIGGMLFTISGTPVPGLRRGGAERFGAPLSNPEAIARSIREHRRRPEVLANRYPDDPTLAEAIRRELEGGEVE